MWNPVRIFKIILWTQSCTWEILAYLGIAKNDPVRRGTTDGQKEGSVVAVMRGCR